MSHETIVHWDAMRLGCVAQKLRELHEAKVDWWKTRCSENAISSYMADVLLGTCGEQLIFESIYK